MGEDAGTARGPLQDVERARSDYLAVSRNAGRYADLATYERAEERAWQRLQTALAALEREGHGLTAAGAP